MSSFIVRPETEKITKYVVVLVVPSNEKDGNPGLWDWATLIDTSEKVEMVASIETAPIETKEYCGCDEGARRLEDCPVHYGGP